MAAARRICEDLGVELKPAPPEGYPSIECVVGPRRPISEVVEQVAEAVDRIFDLAARRELK
jgi:hypothetical protein